MFYRYEIYSQANNMIALCASEVSNVELTMRQDKRVPNFGDIYCNKERKAAIYVEIEEQRYFKDDLAKCPSF